MILSYSVDNFHKFLNFLVAGCYLHSLSSKNIRRSYKYGISQSVSYILSFFRSKYSSPCRSWNLALFKNFVKQLSIFSGINILSLCTKNRNPHLHKRFCQLNSCLSTKLNYRSIRFFNVYNVFNIFRRKWFKVKLISYIKVS